LLAGRDLTWADLSGYAPVALISENTAREIWREPTAALGKRIRSGVKGEWREVIGVVADVHDDGIDYPAPSIVYWPLLMRNFEDPGESVQRGVAYVIRTPRAGSTALGQEIREAIATVNGSLPLADVKTLQSVYERSMARTSFTLMLLGIASAMALLLGVVGIYGTISFSVAQRTREVGIRLALGSSARGITGMFIRQAETGAGLLCGLAAALPLSQFMRSVIYGVSPSEPVTYVGASAALIVAAGLASYLPARRATRINSVDALRTE
jgi:ABC-type antimicrobial peptide transport system permease subunit